MNIDFDNLPWHDAELIKVDIPRSLSDVVKLTVRWPDSEDQESVLIEFYDCYGFHANMNFGILPPDNIIDASVVEQSEALDKIKEKWKESDVDLSLLKCYRVQTNSTNSLIEIFALGYRKSNRITV